MTREKNWHALAKEEVLSTLGTDENAGLSDAEYKARLQQYGENVLPRQKSAGLLVLFFSQFKSPLIYLLLGAAALAAFLGHYNDAIIICGVVVLNAIVGTLQENKAKRSLESLRRFSKIKTSVIRNGHELTIDAAELVPGDIFKVATGDAIPADARLLEARALKTSEGQLTGESTPVVKEDETLAEATRVSERSNMVYAGTHAVSGRGVFVVVATGVDTELGKIAKLSEEAVAEQTPLEAKIARFGRHVLVVAALVLVSMLSVGLLRGLAFGEILIIAISQIVGLIPEGLPVAVTVAQAVAVQRMAKRRALTRRLSALETLGSVNIICTDKTGTLTENQMTVTAICLLGNRELQVTGTGYSIDGKILEDDREVDVKSDQQLSELLLASVLCNDARIASAKQNAEQTHALGDPTELALVTVAKKAGLDAEALRKKHKRMGELPFDSSIKMMATAHEREGRHFIAIKGAPEAILALCSKGLKKDGVAKLGKKDVDELNQYVETMAKRALRVIAVAIIDDATINDKTNFDSFKKSATFLGFLGQIDPPRTEVKAAIEVCRTAGIKPVMVTGDHKDTGHAIAHELGIEGDVLDGEELAQISDGDLKRMTNSIGVFARVLPAQKLRIVNAYKAKHNVVAMTGDGVNDAPALVRADVGVAMGESGTEVAKEAAKIVITDDNFATIVAAIEQGRVVFQNIQKAILLLITTAAAETLILFLAIALGYPPPFTAVQILWINLVTETAITINLVMDPPEGNEMTTPPIPRMVALVPKALFFRICLMTLAIVAASLGWFIYRIHDGVNVVQAQTEAFTMLVICDWFNVLNCRSRTRTALSLSLFKNSWLVGGLSIAIALQFAVIYWRPLGDLFHTKPIDLKIALIMTAIASGVLLVEELRKVVARANK